MNNQPTIISKTKASTQANISKSTLYNRIKEGLMPPLISLGGRRVGMITAEINAVIQARIEAKTDTEIKALVQELIKQRTQIV